MAAAGFEEEEEEQEQEEWVFLFLFPPRLAGRRRDPGRAVQGTGALSNVRHSCLFYPSIPTTPTDRQPRAIVHEIAASLEDFARAASVPSILSLFVAGCLGRRARARPPLPASRPPPRRAICLRSSLLTYVSALSICVGWEMIRAVCSDGGCVLRGGERERERGEDGPPACSRRPHPPGAPPSAALFFGRARFQTRASKRGWFGKERGGVGGQDQEIARGRGTKCTLKRGG